MRLYHRDLLCYRLRLLRQPHLALIAVRSLHIFDLILRRRSLITAHHSLGVGRSEDAADAVCLRGGLLRLLGVEAGGMGALARRGNRFVLHEDLGHAVEFDHEDVAVGVVIVGLHQVDGGARVVVVPDLQVLGKGWEGVVRTHLRLLCRETVNVVRKLLNKKVS